VLVVAWPDDDYSGISAIGDLLVEIDRGSRKSSSGDHYRISLMSSSSFRVVGPQDGPLYQVLANRVTLKASAADTNGAYSLFEIRTDTRGGMPPHWQRYDDEALWVLEGTYAFQFGEKVVTLGAGGYVYVRRSTLHAFANCGQMPARMLMLVTPGGIHERFFAEAGMAAAYGETSVASGVAPDWPRLTNIARKYGIEILPPSGG
jgi:mannose-6-phosphate isomerase-like protein (cupin superfamily)